MAKQAPLKVELSQPEPGRTRALQLAVVVGLGFGFGVLWPWLAGVRLAPSAPVEELATVASATGSADPAASEEEAIPTPILPPSREERLVITDIQVLECRDQEGAKAKQCDSPAIDPLLRPRILALQECAGSAGAEGVQSLGFQLDFSDQKVLKVFSGKSTKLAEDVNAALLKCAESAVKDVTLDGIDHDQDEYTLYYLLEWKRAAGNEGPGVTAASGSATVRWNSAQVRKSPAEDAERVARLLGGTKVQVLGKSGDWYKVRYDGKGHEGWVFGAALGL